MAQRKQHSKEATPARQSATAETAAKKLALRQHEKQRAAPEERHHMIAHVAYFIAEQRGFQGDMVLDDWLQAEAQVDAQFAGRH